MEWVTAVVGFHIDIICKQNVHTNGNLSLLICMMHANSITGHLLASLFIQAYLDLLQILSTFLVKAGVEFIMCDGTLLGSYVSHGFLPWDDDADMMVNIKDIHKVKLLFR